jgi:SAM-dependent methyltransferase
MRRCVACTQAVGDDWRCDGCGHEPLTLDGVVCLAPAAAANGNGFDPDAFEGLAGVEDESFWFRGRNRLILWALSRYCAGAGSMLEVGCGTGYVLAGIRAAQPGIRLGGAELYLEGMAHARRRVPDAAFYQLDATRIPFEQEWDVVGAFDVLEHVEDDEAFLRGMYRALRPGGRLLVTVPQHPRLWSAADEYAHHVRRYTRRELLQKVDRAGFAVERVTSFMALLLPAMWASRLRDKRRRQAYDPSREHARTRATPVLGRVLDLERACIRRGVDFPAGGSLMVVATRS